jgi:hypothetical protein
MRKNDFNNSSPWRGIVEKAFNIQFFNSALESFLSFSSPIRGKGAIGGNL